MSVYPLVGWLVGWLVRWSVGQSVSLLISWFVGPSLIILGMQRMAIGLVLGNFTYFLLFYESVMDRKTNGPTDQRTNGQIDRQTD